NDFGRVGGVDEFRDTGAGAFVGVGGAHRERVKAAVDVAVVAFVEARERVDDDAGFLGGGGVVEVDERFAVDLLVKGGEVDADVGPGEHNGGNRSRSVDRSPFRRGAFSERTRKRTKNEND